MAKDFVVHPGELLSTTSSSESGDAEQSAPHEWPWMLVAERLERLVTAHERAEQSLAEVPAHACLFFLFPAWSEWA